MIGLRWILVLMSAGAVTMNAPSIFRLFRRGVELSQTWRGAYRGQGEYVDAARRMAECAVANGRAVAFCSRSNYGLLPVERSRVLAMSWATFPCLVGYSTSPWRDGVDVVVASENAVRANREMPKVGYRQILVEGGLKLWAKMPLRLNYVQKMRRVVPEILACAGFCVFLIIAFLYAGVNGACWWLIGLSLSEFLMVACFRCVGWVQSLMSAGAVLLLIILFGRGVNSRRFHLIAFFMAFFVLCVSGVLALSHTFFAPNGLGVVGGKARLFFLCKGVPDGFFSTATYSLYLPTYPPGSACVILWFYSIVEFCGEWMVQLVPCCVMALVLYEVACFARSFFTYVLVLVFFLSPLTIRLGNLFYPEVFVALCLMSGWERLRYEYFDLNGWLLVGLSGWFKNEGMVFCCALALAIVVLNFRNIGIPFCQCIVGALLIPLSWQVICRLKGASLDGYATFCHFDFGKGFRAVILFLKYSMLEGWRYAFVYPAAIALRWLRWHGDDKDRERVSVALLFCLFVALAFGVIFSLSQAIDFEWHLESIERLLWTPAIFLLREIVSIVDGYCSCEKERT